MYFGGQRSLTLTWESNDFGFNFLSVTQEVIKMFILVYFVKAIV